MKVRLLFCPKFTALPSLILTLAIVLLSLGGSLRTVPVFQLSQTESNTSSIDDRIANVFRSRRLLVTHLRRATSGVKSQKPINHNKDFKLFTFNVNFLSFILHAT